MKLIYLNCSVKHNIRPDHRSLNAAFLEGGDRGIIHEIVNIVLCQNLSIPSFSDF